MTAISKRGGAPCASVRSAPPKLKILRGTRLWQLSLALLAAMWLPSASMSARGADFGGFFPGVFSEELSALDGSNGFAISGANSRDFAGARVAGAGDINGDGFDDIVVGAAGADPDGKANAGAAYVVFGSDQGFPATLSLSALDGSNGFLLKGISQFDLTGIGVARAGDVNGDGIDDVMIGARGANPNDFPDAGQIYVVFGTDQGFPAELELSALDGSNGFVLRGFGEIARFGFAVARAGDVNDDGFDDIIIGAKEADSNGLRNTGQSYVLFGTDQGFPAVLEASMLDGNDGFTINGVNPGDSSGYSVAGAGDINGDGIDDFMIGARNADPNGKIGAGQAYVVFGTNLGFPPTLELSTLDGSNGFALNGVKGDDRTGQSVDGAGDVNGDGIDDVIIGALTADSNGKVDSGRCYVVFGAHGGFPAALELSALDGTNGFALNAINAFDRIGYSVAGIGDTNNDGIDDIIVGGNGADPKLRTDAGQSYVVFGTDGGFPAALELSALDGNNGFALNGATAGDGAGWGARAGDVNGDSVDDVVVGAFGVDADGLVNTGQSYVVFGRPVVELSITGSCPGKIKVKISGATPSSPVDISSADSRGVSTLGAGACSGDLLDLDSPVLEATVPADRSGRIFVSPTVASEVCGKFVQVIDQTTCLTSNVVQVP